MVRFAGVCAVLVSLSPALAMAADLKVEIEGPRDDSGTVMVALFKDAAAFKADTRFAGAFIAAKPGRVVVAFPELEPGTYALSAFHDQDGNGKLDTNLLGVPTEGYGFSNNAKGLLGPPSFESSSFTVGEEDLTITFQLNY